MKIYTKKGDQGQTRLVGGCLVSKADLRIEAYGAVDEMNSHLGVVIEKLRSVTAALSLRESLLQIQHELFCVGSLLACEEPELLAQLPRVPDAALTRIEDQIDQMTAELPPLKQFILPGGSELAAELHVSRTVCRRAERAVVKLYEKHPEVESALIYLNRLSDHLFTSARWVNLRQGVSDQTWVKP